MDERALRAWAEREAAKLPPLAESEIAEAGRIASGIDARRRALDDPAVLAKAAAMTRTALKRKRSREERIREIADAMPPLTPEQKDELALILGSAQPGRGQDGR